jgi:hypothetical protein
MGAFLELAHNLLAVSRRRLGWATGTMAIGRKLPDFANFTEISDSDQHDWQSIDLFILTHLVEPYFCSSNITSSSVRSPPSFLNVLPYLVSISNGPSNIGVAFNTENIAAFFQLNIFRSAPLARQRYLSRSPTPPSVASVMAIICRNGQYTFCSASSGFYIPILFGTLVHS